MRIIEKVHGDGVLPELRVFYEHNPRFYVAYRFDPITDDAVDIQLLVMDDAEFSIFHEIGHFLDHKGFKGDSFSSSTPDTNPLSGWYKTIKSSNKIISLETMSKKI